MKIWMHCTFKVVWLVSAIAFGVFAYFAHETKSLKLPRHQGRIQNTSSAMNTSMGGISMGETVIMINDMADTYDKSVKALEDSIHDSAHLSFRLNLMCCFAALAGFAAQFGQFYYEHIKKKPGDQCPQQERQLGQPAVKLDQGNETENASQ